MYNSITIVGNLGKDPELRIVGAKNTACCKFSVATSYKRGGEEETTWHNVVLWGKVAEIADQYLKKGAKVLIEGRQVNRTYEKDGQTRYTSEIIGNQMKMLGGRDEQPARSPRRETREPGGDDDFFPNDDIPF